MIMYVIDLYKPCLIQLHIQCAAIKKTPLNKYYYFQYISIFLYEILEIILDTICHYCCEFYLLNFCCSEVPHV